MPLLTETKPRSRLFNDKLYEIYYRFLETDDEYFDYAPAKVPPQGRWRIYGINLPESILRKVYNENAARELHVSAISGGCVEVVPVEMAGGRFSASLRRAPLLHRT